MNHSPRMIVANQVHNFGSDLAEGMGLSVSEYTAALATALLVQITLHYNEKAYKAVIDVTCDYLRNSKVKVVTENDNV